MSSIIGFLEKVGRDATLRHAANGQLLAAMQRDRIAPALQTAILSQDRLEIESMLGARDKMYCATFPVKPTKKPAKPTKKPVKKPVKKPAKTTRR